MLAAVAVTVSPLTTPVSEIVPVAVFFPSYTLPTLLSVVFVVTVNVGVNCFGVIVNVFVISPL